MSNKYNSAGTAIIDASGKSYLTDVWHPMPRPDGIIAHSYTTTGGEVVVTSSMHNCTHWLARRPLPPVPIPKSQEEMDSEAFNNWLLTPLTNEERVIHKTRAAWNAALAYARKTQPTNR